MYFCPAKNLMSIFCYCKIILKMTLSQKIIFFGLFLGGIASLSAQHSNPIDSAEEIKSYTKHHLGDSHDFSFYIDPKTGQHVGFSLPVIVWSSKGFTCFMSSAFDHNDNGEVVVDKSGMKFSKIHGKIYQLEEGANKVSFDDNHHPTNAHRVLDFSITKNVVGMLLVSILLFLGFGSLAKSYKVSSIPIGIGRFLEPLVLYVRDEIAKPNIGERHYKKYMSFLLTLFFFIWISNLLGLTPLGLNITGNIAVTTCMALFTFIIVQFSGNKNYWKHIFWMPNVPIPMKILLIPIEIIGVFTKPFALLIRLFANITAGHTVVMGLVALIYTGKEMLGVGGSIFVSFALTLFITVLELLITFLQAYIFTMLSSLFIGMAVEEHH